MKYLFVTRNRFPPDRVDVKVLFGEELTRRGHRIDWLLPSGGPRRRSGVEPYGNGQAWVSACSPGNSPFAKLRRLVQELLNDLKVFGLVRRGGYDFVQVKDRFVGGALALAAARWNRVPFVFWLAYPFPEAWIYEARSGVARFPMFSRLRGWLSWVLLYKIVLPGADLAFVQSRQMLEDVAREGIAPEKLYPVPMGVSTEFLEPAPRPARHDPPIVLYVGTMIRVRRLDFILRAFARVLERVPRAVLYMIGGESADDIDALRAEAVRLAIDSSVRFTGPLPRAEAIAWMRAARVCVSPFYPTPILNSTSPTKLVEYMSQGTAVVATAHPEQSRVIDESGGGLCVPYDEVCFADAITRLLENPERAEAMGADGRRYVEATRSYANIAAMVDARYRALLGASAQRPAPAR